ncbi:MULTISPECIES: catechol 2,3-dioxygenase [Acinetobacter]|uniref:catechol 2,3-dioxygenase n=1 Tax=Acinetobacter TaxID=469 RepID=UPI0020309374|nr:catechol 2,3-dioxygenase [Acinetobacter modestus]MCM1959127.1 catechol 2,3-dioxygenase [Acinetobacter modestus]
MAILRIGHVDINVMDMDKALHHYINILGLYETSRDKYGKVYLKGWDEWESYCLVLTPSDSAGVNHIAYKVECDEDLINFAKHIQENGVDVKVNDVGELYECGASIQFNLPSGHLMYLYHEKKIIGKATGQLNPEPWPDDIQGAGVHWLDHVMLMCPVDETKNTVLTTTQFLQECLGFHMAERVIDPEDNLMATWLFRGTKPHDLALGPAPTMGLHHIAFYVDDWNSILKSADILGKNKVKVDVTPQRHAITRGQTTYFFDPSGNRNEIFAGLGYFAQPDMPVITWKVEELWRGIFFHQGEPRPDFLEIYS